MNENHERSAVDLNLLVVLDALLRTHSVTGAAGALGVTQSAVSHALARLRSVFDDPLLVRAGNSMSPTALAADLAEPTRRIVSDARHVLARRAFDPAREHRAFCIAAADFAEAMFVPPLLQAVQAHAPNVRLAFAAPGDDVDRAVRDGDVDLAIGAFFRPLAGLRAQKLFDEPFVCAVRAGHPLGARLTLDGFARAEHVLVAPRGKPGGVVDDALAAVGRRRKVVFRTTRFLAAFLAIERSDLVLTAPAGIAAYMAQRLPLVVRQPPLALPSFAVSILFNDRVRSDPAHVWLRERVVECAAVLAPAGRRRAPSRPPRAT